MRKVLHLGICLLIVIFSASCWANSKKVKFNGFYIGLDGGADSWNLRNTIEFFDNDVSTIYPAIRVDNNTGRLGASGGLFTGWAFVEGKSYMSLELNLDILSNMHNSKSIATYTDGSVEFVVSEKQQYAGSLDFHGGYIFSNVALLYFTAGYALERFKSTADFTITGAESSAGSLTTNTNIQATRVGIGGEYAFNRNWRLRTEFFAKFYSNKPYFLNDIALVQTLTDGNTINASRTYMAYYVGVLRQF